jgi:V/A-type H+-transporting ATPase subunit B
MSILYQKVQKVIGPLLFLKNKHNVQYEEIVQVQLEDESTRFGQVVKMDEEIIVVELFESTKGISSENAKILFTRDTFKVKISDTDMFGQTFNSLGKPIDLETKKELKYNLLTDHEKDIYSYPINPFARDYPSEVIQTGISVIDGLFTLIRGQKLPIFSGQGLSHNKLATQIVTQARVLTEEPFLIIFCGIGIIEDDAINFLKAFRESGNIQNIISFMNFASDPVMERLIVPRVALTTAEYFAFEKDMHVLVILIDMTNYAEALRELSSAKEEIPSRKGYPGYLYSDLASIYERTGKIKGKDGSITQIPILTMKNDDISDPVPDTTGYITEGQLVLERELYKKGIYPPFDVLSSISRLMKDAIGKETTREDHADVSSQLLSLYSNSLEIRDLLSIVGKEGLSNEQRTMLKFGNEFEKSFLNQQTNENRDFIQTLSIAWKILSELPRDKLVRIHDKFIDKYYRE